MLKVRHLCCGLAKYEPRFLLSPVFISLQCSFNYKTLQGSFNATVFFVVVVFHKKYNWKKISLFLVFLFHTRIGRKDGPIKNMNDVSHGSDFLIVGDTQSRS